MAVVLGHFSMTYMPQKMMSFGNHFIAIFFILSGYGLYHSLKKKSGANRLKKFYFKRFIRIYPIYWVCFSLKLIFDTPGSLDVKIILEFFLLHFVNPPSIWFLHALMPCYLIAPLIFKIVEETKLMFIIYLISFFLIINIAFSWFDVQQVRCLVYRGLYLNHVLLFSVGMVFPVLRKKFDQIFNAPIVGIVFCIMIFSFLQTSEYALRDFNNQTFNRILFTVSVLIFTYIFIFSKVSPPLFKIISRIGVYSYSIFIFDGMYKVMLNRFGILEGKSYENLMWYLLFFPLFFLGAAIIEELINNRLDIKKALQKFTKSIRMSEAL